MANDGNSPCTVTRVIDRTAQRIADVAKKLDASANIINNDGVKAATLSEDLKRDARELRQCAYQLTGKAY